MKCGRFQTSRHAKNYNHKEINKQGNKAYMCEFCHKALHLVNKNNDLDWEYLMRVKRKEILKKAQMLEKRNHNLVRDGGRVNSLNSPKPSQIIKSKEVKQ